LICTPLQAATYCLTQASIAFFCAEEPEAWSWPLASSHLMLLLAAALASPPLLLPPVSSEPLKLHLREFLPGAAVLNSAACVEWR
jgi:hypothetical protein